MEQTQAYAPAQQEQTEVQAAAGNASDASQNGADAGRQNGMPGKGDVQKGTEPGAVQKTVTPAGTEDSRYTATTETDGDAAAASEKSPAAAGLRDDTGNQLATNMQTGGATSVAGNAAADAAEGSRYTKENVLRIVDRVSTQAKDGRYDFDVELKPDFLGKVSIKLTMEDGNIRMQIRTDDASVRGMLSDQTSSLQSALREKGITLASVDVTYESQASLSGDRQAV